MINSAGADTEKIAEVVAVRVAKDPLGAAREILALRGERADLTDLLRRAMQVVLVSSPDGDETIFDEVKLYGGFDLEDRIAHVLGRDEEP